VVLIEKIPAIAEVDELEYRVPQQLTILSISIELNITPSKTISVVKNIKATIKNSNFNLVYGRLGLLISK
jgi:hypothetical protein